MAFWSLHLANALLEGLSESTLRRSWGSDSASVPVADVRRELARWSLVEEEVRRLVMADWRHQESSVVEGTELLAVEELIECWDELARLHGSERLLLALLTEADEDTEENVELLLRDLAGGTRRSTTAFWQSLQDREERAARNVLLVGGDPSERARVDAMSEKYRLRVTWVPAARTRGHGPAQDSLAAASRADLVVVVTGRIGHSLMHGARRAAERLRAPCHYIERLSERQLDEALAWKRGSLRTAAARTDRTTVGAIEHRTSPRRNHSHGCTRRQASAESRSSASPSIRISPTTRGATRRGKGAASVPSATPSSPT